MSKEFTFLVFCGIFLVAGASDWEYKGHKGPMHWRDLFPDACNGAEQSPIDIKRWETKYNPELNDFAIWFDPPKPGSTFQIINNGHAVQVNIQGPMKVANGGLPSEYTSKQFHFHWGHANHHGSEHLINGWSYPLEMHIVNYDSVKYLDIAAAMVQPMGLAVLGVMFEISDHDNPVLEPIIKALKHIRDPDLVRDVEIPAMPIRSFLPEDTTKYFRYNGSLTTPGCFESVIWTVFENKQYISHRQLDEFRNVLQRKKHHEPAKKNHGHDRRRKRNTPKERTVVRDVLEEAGIEGDRLEKDALKFELAEKKAEPEPTLGVPPEKVGLFDHESNPDLHEINSMDLEPKPHNGDEDDDDLPAYEIEKIKHYREQLVNNFRPVQPLNGRTVYRSFEFEPTHVFKHNPDTKNTKSAPQTDGKGDNSAASRLPSVVMTLCCLLFAFVKSL